MTTATPLFSVPTGPSRHLTQAVRPELAKSGPQLEIIRGFDPASESKGEGLASNADGRRSHPRLEIRGGVEIQQVGTDQPYWGYIGDLSQGGIYVQTIQPLPVDTFVNVLMRVEGFEIRATAMVRTCHPHVGMGLCFAEIDLENREKLHHVIERLEHRSGLDRRTKPRTGTAIFMPPRVEREPEAPPAVPSAPVQDENQLSQRMQELASELRALDQGLGQVSVDARLCRNFHEASDFARQAAWAVQNFIDYQRSNRDPFAVFQQLEADRIKLLIELCRATILDIDSKQLDTENETILELVRVVDTLNSRLSRLARTGLSPAR